MRRRDISAFSLIELLTVIAIIALLVALLFPVFSRAREQARQATCLTNMHEMYVKANLYKQDYGAYPPLLLGLPENADGTPWAPGGGAPVTPGMLKHGYLVPSYVRSITSFHCPNNAVTDQTVIVSAVFPANAGFSGNATYGTHGIEAVDPGQAIPFYAWDSYDITRDMGSTGPYTVTYSRDWTNAEGRGIDTRTDEPNQLKYPNPPLDKTVLCWCYAHATTSGNVPIILASGTARTAPAREVQSKTWTYAGP